MAQYLVRLKWQLLRNGLRTDKTRAIGMPLFTLVMVAAGLLLGRWYWSALQSLTPAAAAELSLWVAVVGAIGWGTLPVLLFPIDENLDPAKFAILPFTKAQLMTGLIGAATLTPPVVLPVLVMGANVGYFTGILVTPIAIAGTGLIIISMSILGQVVTTAFSMLVKSRRGRDLTMFVVVGIAIGLYAAQSAAARTLGQLGLEGAMKEYPMSPYAWLTPPGAAQQGVIAAADGEFLLTAIFFGLTLAWLALLVGLWHTMLQRLITQPELTATRSASKMPALTDLRAWSAVGVMARKDLRSYVRDPRMRMVWTGGIIFIAVFAAALMVGATQMEVLRRSEWIVMATPAAVLFVGLPVALNQFGWERRAASFLFVLPANPRDLLVGKNVATFIALSMETAALALIAALVTGGFAELWLVPPIFVTAAGAQLAIGNIASVLTPLRLPDMGTDVFSQASEHGCLAISSQLVSFFIIGMLLVPVAIAVTLSQLAPDAVYPWAVAVGSVAWGIIVYWAGLSVAARLLKRRMPEILKWVQVV